MTQSDIQTDAYDQNPVLFFPAGFARPFDRRVRHYGLLEGTIARAGSLEVRFATTRKDIRKAQKLRFKVFYQEGQAKADQRAILTRRDICPFDRVSDHLLVIDHAAKNRFGVIKPKVVGCYRLLRQEVAQANAGFYSAQEFDIMPLLHRHAGKRFMELGRSCVAKNYRSKKTLDLLWRGIWAYVQHYRVDVMIGCASFPGTNPSVFANAFGFLQNHAAAQPQWNVTAQTEHGIPLSMLGKNCLDADLHPDNRKAMNTLPPLIKGYLRVGAGFGSEAVIDHQFGTTDVFVVMPIADIESRYIQHFGGKSSNRANLMAA